MLAAGEQPVAFVRDLHAGRAPDSATPLTSSSATSTRPKPSRQHAPESSACSSLTRQSARQPDWERNVIDAAVRAGARHLVKLSVFRADRRSPLRIARQHHDIERSLERSGLGYTIIRPVFLTQNLLGMVR